MTSEVAVGEHSPATSDPGLFGSRLPRLLGDERAVDDDAGIDPIPRFDEDAVGAHNAVHLYRRRLDCGGGLPALIGRITISCEIQLSRDRRLNGRIRRWADRD